MISVYQKTTRLEKDGTEEEGWIDTIKFNEGHVRNMFLKKRNKIEMDQEMELSKQVSRMTNLETGEK